MAVLLLFLMFFLLPAGSQGVFADEQIEDVRSPLSDPSQASGRKPQSHDDAYAALANFVEQLGAGERSRIGLGGRSNPDAADGRHDPEQESIRASLLQYVQQIDAERPQLIKAGLSGFHHDVSGDPAYATLRQYAQQIGVDQPSSSSSPPMRLAEADNAFDALRELFRRGEPPPESTPSPAPKSTPRPTPPQRRPAAPAAPRHEPPVVFATLIGERVCVMCHANQAALFGTTLMGRIHKTQPGKLDCESCHGPGSEHLKAVGCAACHGEGGITHNPGTPSLIGQDPQYLVAAMRSYVNGQRKVELKRMILSGIGGAELNNIARYYARQFAGRAETPPVGSPGAGRGSITVCAGCHGERGVSIVPAWPNLAGQDALYLANAIRAYKSGLRTKAIACAACHGEGGVSRTPGMPSLVGQDPEYLVPAMRAYVTGERKHGLMGALLSGVSDTELNNMAAYYAGQVPARAVTPAVGDPTAGKRAGALCVGCHGEGDGPINAAWPNLAGQDARYLAEAIEAYKDGSRSKTVACAACHGERGISKTPGVPSLVGLDAQYLVTAMKAYASGARKNEVMKLLLAGVSESELNSIAAYYARQGPERARTSAVGDVAAGKSAAAACTGCHVAEGVSPNAAWPSLAGQDARYLALATKAYNNGSRSDETMKALVAGLDERTINNIASYYASLAPARPPAPTSAPTSGDPVLVSNALVSGLDQRTINDIASYFASLGPTRAKGAPSAGGGRDPVLIRNNLVASLDERAINNVASYYASLHPVQPLGTADAPGGPFPPRVGLGVPIDGSSIGGIISYRKNDPSRRVEDSNAVCLNCHERGQRTYWRGSTHETRGLACTECHTIMKNVSAANQLKTAFEPNTCFQCHKDRQAQMFRSSHMPVREGKIVCSSCHNPHGSAYVGSNASMLWQDSINDNCYKCHAEKRGPFLFEHAPVRENCLNCHDPHGSINEYSLKMSRPRLCYECHTIGHGQAGLNSQFTASRSCQNCHTLIHGSNSPAGAVFQR
jgi:DmsE family decaheme c-type cytochrome